jgi:hypothetical protein
MKIESSAVMIFVQMVFGGSYELVGGKTPPHNTTERSYTLSRREYSKTFFLFNLDQYFLLTRIEGSRESRLDFLYYVGYHRSLFSKLPGSHLQLKCLLGTALLKVATLLELYGFIYDLRNKSSSTILIIIISYFRMPNPV